MSSIARRWCLLCSLCALGPAGAADVSIGPFCMTGVDQKADPTDLSFTNGSQWMRVRYGYKAPTSGSDAKLVIFTRPVPQDDPAAPPDCAAMQLAAASKGIPVLLAGTIEELALHARIGIGQYGNRLWVDPDGKISITMRKVTSGLQHLGGGTLDLKGSWLWIRGIGPLLSTPDQISGLLEIEAYNRIISDAEFALPGGASGSASLRQLTPDAENLVVRLNTSSGVADLWRGTLGASDVRMKGGSVLLPSVAVAETDVVAGRVILTAKDGSISGELRRIHGSAAGIATSASAGTGLDGSAVSVRKGNLSGLVAQSTAAFTWSSLEATDFEVEAVEGRLWSQKSVVASGSASARIARLAENEVRATVDWATPRISGMPISVPEGNAQALQLVFTGTPGVPVVSGKASAAAFGLSGLDVQRTLSLSFAAKQINGLILLPIDVNLPGLGGQLTLSDYDQRVLVSAGVDGFRLQGVLELDPSDLVGGSKLRIPPAGLKTGLSAALSLRPWLAGTKPGFAKTKVSINNADEVVIGRSPEGSLTLDTSLLTLVEPVMRIGEKGKEKRASVRLNSEGAASFTYPVKDRQLVLQKARFEMADLQFSFLDPGGTIDIGGTLVEEPRLSMEHLTIDLDRKANVGTIVADRLTVEGSRFDHPRDSKSETAFSGRQARPFSIGMLRALPEFNDTSITVRHIVAAPVDFALDEAILTLGDAVTLREASVFVHADQVSSIDEIQKNEDGTDQIDENGTVVRKRREYLANLQVAANGLLKESEFSDAMQLDVPPTVSGLRLDASGRSDKLDGNGEFALSAFSGLFRDKVEFQFACKDGSHPTAPSETRFSTGGTAGPLRVKVTGGKFAVQGALLGLNLLYKSDTSVECDSRSQPHVISPKQEWWTWGVCPTWREPFRKCKWSTTIPEVSFSYHLRFGFYGLAGAATVTAPIFMVKDGETKFCFIPPVSFNPLAIAMGISPQIEVSNGTPGEVEKILNGLIHAALVPIESTFLTTLGNTAALAVGTIVSTPEGATLACALLRKDL